MTQCNHPGPTCTCRKEGLIFDSAELARLAAAVRQCADNESKADANDELTRYVLEHRNALVTAVAEREETRAALERIEAVLESVGVYMHHGDDEQTAVARAWSEGFNAALDKVRAARRGDES